MTQLDLEFVYSQFPAFAASSIQGKALFDCAGGGEIYARRLAGILGGDAGPGLLRPSFLHSVSRAGLGHPIKAPDQVL